MEITLGQLAVQLQGTLVGGGVDTVVAGVSGYDTVGEDEVTFTLDQRRLAAAEASPALAIIAPLGTTSACKPLVLVENPRAAFSRALALFDWRRPPMAGIDSTAVIARSAAIHGRAHVGAFCTVGEGAVIGDGCVIYPHCVIGDHVEIGAETIVYPQVTIYARCTLGRRVIIHSGTVIGADGFGYHPGPQGLEKIPHLGTVVIEDDVEIGALTTVDRATTGVTRIGHGSKIDNLVQIAHNVQIGPHCIIVAQAGIAGSATIDEGAILGGQAGVADHIHLGAGARVGAKAGISKDIPPGTMVSGYPAQNHADELRQEAALRKLPQLLQTVKTLEKRVAELEAQQQC